MRITTVLLFLLLVLSFIAKAQAPDAWAPVQQLAHGTSVKVSGKDGGVCIVQTVSTNSLVCAHGSSTRSIPRDEIKSIKLARRGHSAVVGLALGAGIGAGVGAGVGVGINSSNTGNILHTSGAKSAGTGAAIGVILGTATGGIVGYSADLFASPIVYKR